MNFWYVGSEVMKILRDSNLLGLGFGDSGLGGSVLRVVFCEAGSSGFDGVSWVWMLVEGFESGLFECEWVLE